MVIRDLITLVKSRIAELENELKRPHINSNNTRKALEHNQKILKSIEDELERRKKLKRFYRLHV